MPITLQNISVHTPIFVLNAKTNVRKTNIKQQKQTLNGFDDIPRVSQRRDSGESK